MPVFNFARRDGGQINYIKLALRLRMPFAVLTMGAAILGALTNFLGVDGALQPLGQGAATHPVTALCLFTIGLGAFQHKRFGRRSIVRLIIGTAIISVCATRLMEAALTGSAGAPGLAIFGPFGGFQGRFSLEAAITLGAFGLADVLRQGLGRFGMTFLTVGLAVVFNALLELSFGMTFFHGEVGAFTLIGMICAAITMVTLYVHRPTVRVAFLPGDVGHQTRTMALAAIVIPWLGGFFLFSVKDGGAGTFEAGVISAITWSMLVILISSAARQEGSVAARHRAEKELAMQSRRDPLTGALNRFGMTEVMEGAWVDFKSSGAHYGMVLLDLDYFRKLDSTFGQNDGEAVLARVADTVQDQLRTTDALGRWGSDEFLVLLKVKEKADMAIVANRLRAALIDPTAPFCAGLTMTPATMDVALGIGTMEDSDEAPTDAITRADDVLHIAKTAHDPISLSDTEVAHLFDTQAEMLADLHGNDLQGDELINHTSQGTKSAAA